MTDKTFSEGRVNDDTTQTSLIAQTIVQVAVETLMNQAGINKASALIFIYQVAFDTMIHAAATPALAMCNARVDMMNAYIANDQRAMENAIAANTRALHQFCDQCAALTAKALGG